MEKFDSAKMDQIPKRNNAKMDSLAKFASIIQSKEPRTISIELVTQPNICPASTSNIRDRVIDGSNQKVLKKKKIIN